MKYVKGNIRTTIYYSESGFFVGTFKIKETDDEELKEKINKTITVTGLLLEVNDEDTYVLYGNYVRNDRYGYQFSFQSYEKAKPEGKDAVIEFLSSNLIKGCGEKTAQKIVEVLGDNAIDLIKQDKKNLLLVPSMTEKKATTIYLSLLQYSEIDDTLILLKQKGFTMNEATKIVKKYLGKATVFLEENLYIFKEFVPFAKLDRIFLKDHDLYDAKRIYACLKEAMEYLKFTNGDTYSFLGEIQNELQQQFNLFIEQDQLEQILEELRKKDEIVKREEKYFLKEYDDMEKGIASNLFAIESHSKHQVKDYEKKVKQLEEILHVQYNEEQKEAIYKALKYPISIISGGPGTGKTTIVNAITKLYIELYHLSPLEVFSQIALLAPTGRAAKKMAMSTGLPASTIHRYLKWNKETDDFQINATNKNHHKLIIVDEMSMVDTYLFFSLLEGIEQGVQLVLVGDTFQLPSVGAGQILNDLVESKLFSYTPLKMIYRQSENSYIPYLAKEIKDHKLSNSYLEKKDDYNFITCDAKQLKKVLCSICEKSLEKGILVDDIQVLAPMYKGENGIDNLNQVLQALFNPASTDKKETTYFDITYREQDKVLQLVNNPDCNVYNGDIGHIVSISERKEPKKKVEITIDFDGNYVIYSKEELNNIKHAYVISIHKSQGSEFPHVIIPISKAYYKMLYNKLIYTGVSRAKKSLILLGDENSFLMSVQNDYATHRKTDLLAKLKNRFQ